MGTLTLGDSGREIYAIQLALQVIGYDPGPLDGVFGPRTEYALERFQLAVLVTGRPDIPTTRALTAALKKHLDSQHVMDPPTPIGLDNIKRTFGDFEFRSLPTGFIEIDPDWVKRNITRPYLPIVGSIDVHVKVAPIITHVLREIESIGLGDHIEQFGAWCGRHKNFDTTRSLSTHSWGIACDINWHDNPFGEIGRMDPRIVDIFERHGFQWGGRWRRRDDMHFQYCRGY
jgi:hypothetical protein